MNSVFISYLSVVFSGDDDQEEGEEEKLPSCMDYIMHFVCLFWKVLFAFVPPTGKSSKDFSSAYKTHIVELHYALTLTHTHTRFGQYSFFKNLSCDLLLPSFHKC